MLAVKPVLHSLLRIYWHLLTVTLLEELDETTLDFELELDLALELTDETTELLDLELELKNEEIELLDFTLDTDDELELVATLLELPTIP